MQRESLGMVLAFLQARRRPMPMNQVLSYGRPVADTGARIHAEACPARSNALESARAGETSGPP